MTRSLYGGLAAGLMVLAACAVAIWCFQHGLLDPNTRAGSRFLIVFAVIMAAWAFLGAAAFLAFRKSAIAKKP